MSSSSKIRRYKSTFANNSLGWFSAVWGIFILVPLIYFPAPSILAGHPWKVELVTSAVLLIGLIGVNRNGSLRLAVKLFSPITITAICFVVWSGTSVLWANSSWSVAHHTLVWANYVIFFILAIAITTQNRLFTIFSYSLGLIVAIIATICLIEFFFAEQLTMVFGFRYGRYTEIHATLLPFFVALTLKLKRTNLLCAVILSILMGLAIFVSGSRSSLLGAIIGLGLFFGFRVLLERNWREIKKIGRIVASAVVLLAFIQVWSVYSANNRTTTLNRIEIVEQGEASNSLQQNVRYLFWNVGLGMFRENLALGVGADNFGLEFNKYREIFARNEQNKLLAEQQEGMLPERAHNEYLQILTELGVVGALLFIAFLGGIAKLALPELINRQNRDLLTDAAIAGLTTFLITSAFSSYSFRLMQNGLVFFFLLAVILRNPAKRFMSSNDSHFSNLLNKGYVYLGIICCLSLTIFSALKATSQYLVYRAELEPNEAIALEKYKDAATIDPANGSANFLLGYRMFSQGKFELAVPHLKLAVEKGLNSSVGYALLGSNQSLANQNDAADDTFRRGIDIFPYSVFLRVKYAVALERAGKSSLASNQLSFARSLDKQQAETWLVLITEGEDAVLEKAKSNPEIITIGRLMPREALGPVLVEREILHPEERMENKLERLKKQFNR